MIMCAKTWHQQRKTRLRCVLSRKTRTEAFLCSVLSIILTWQALTSNCIICIFGTIFYKSQTVLRGCMVSPSVSWATFTCSIYYASALYRQVTVYLVC